VEYDQSSSEVRKTLVYYKVPESSSASFEIPKTELRAVVSFATETVIDPDICKGTFWRVTFNWKICNMDESSDIHDGQWTYGNPH